jgi:hypothetical protein
MEGAAGMAILIWLSPILVPILAAGVLVFMLPLLVGVAVATGRLVSRSVYLFTPRHGRPAAEVLSSPGDPWTRLIALHESAQDPETGEQRTND